MWEEILSFLPLIFAFGPGLFLFARYQVRGTEPSLMALGATVAFAYYLLLQAMVYRSDIERDHRIVCKQLAGYMMKADPEEMENGDGLPVECDRYTKAYRQEQADYEASLDDAR